MHSAACSILLPDGGQKWSKSGPPAGREIVKQLIKAAKRQSWQEPGRPRYLSILLYLSWKSSGGPERLRFVSKHHQTEKALDMCMALVSTLPRVFQRRKAAPTHPLEEKATHRICREPNASCQLLKAHTPKLRSDAHQKRALDLSYTPQKLSRETSSFPLSPSSGVVSQSRKHSTAALPGHNTQDIHYWGADLRDQATCAQRRLTATSCITGIKKTPKQAGNCSETARREQKLCQLVTVKRTPLTSPLPFTAPQAVGKEIRTIRCLESTESVVHPSWSRPQKAVLQPSLTWQKWRLQQTKSRGTVRTPITWWHYKATSTQITIQPVISHSRKLLIWLGKNPYFAVVETKVKRYTSPPQRACARPCTWMLGQPTPLPAFIFSAYSALSSHKCSTSVRCWTTSDLFWSFIKDD